MADLSALFDSVDGIKEDVMEFGIAGLSAFGANAAFDGAADAARGLVPEIAAKVPGFVRPLVKIAAGLAAGRYLGPLAAKVPYLGKYDRQIATGAAIGLVGMGIGQLVNGIVGRSVVPGIADFTIENVSGLGAGDLFRRYTSGMGNSPTTIEEQGMGAAPLTIEDNVAGFGGYGNYSQVAPTLTGFTG